MIQTVIAIASLIIAVVFILKKVFKPTVKSGCDKNCSCH